MFECGIISYCTIWLLPTWVLSLTTWQLYASWMLPTWSDAIENMHLCITRSSVVRIGWQVLIRSQGSFYSKCAASDSCTFSADGAGMMLWHDVLRGILCYGNGASSSGAVRSILYGIGRKVLSTYNINLFYHPYLLADVRWNYIFQEWCRRSVT